jgi:tetratricopeptide (TPR) repeat protein
VGDRGGEATTLINIGAVYDALGEQRKALEYYEQALLLFRQVGDRRGESNTRTRYSVAMVHQAAAEEQLRQVVAFDEAIGHPDLERDRVQLARIQRLRRARHP